MKIVRTIDRDDLRNFCIKFNLCTRCDIDTYDLILDTTVFDANDDNDLQVLATLIARNSEEQTTSNVLFLLLNHCIVYTVEQ